MMYKFLLIPLLLSAVGAAQQKRELPEGSGRPVVQRLCASTCHGAEKILGRQFNEEGWADVIGLMMQRGLKAGDDEIYEAVGYLVRNIRDDPAAKVHINRDTAEDLEIGLAIPEKAAAAIVRARERGPIRSLDDLKKVPGIDPARIEARKDRLVF